MTGDLAAAFLERLERVAERLRSLARVEPPEGLTDPDQPSGERWEWGQVWAHTAELGGYWLDQVDRVLSGADGFGRTKKDPHRIASIEAGRATDAVAQLGVTRAAMARLRRVVAGVGEDAWSARSAHPTLGVMGLDDILQHFLVGHYEEHAAQLEGLG